MFNSYKLNTLRFDPEECTGCGMCISVCPHAVFARRGKEVVLADPEACMECGACFLNCPTVAIEVESGVGCASAMIRAALTGGEVSCGCGGGGKDNSGGGCC